MPNECQRIHETIVRDILDVMNDVKDYDEVDWMRVRNNTGSIARRASNLTLVFPVMVSTTISYQTAIIITKAIERKCVALMQILFQAYQYTNATDLAGHLKQFHTNLDLRRGFTLNDMIDAIDYISDMEESAISEDDRIFVEAVRRDMPNLEFYLDTEYNPRSLNDYRFRKNYYGESTVLIHEAPSSPRNEPGARLSNRDMDSYLQRAKNASDYYQKQLTQADCNKANELMPTTMLVNFLRSDGNGAVINQQAVVGIKAKMYLVDSMDIINRVASKYKDSNALFNLVRASTREISFFKDLAFAIDKAKIDAVNMASNSDSAKMFKVLERRAAKNRFSTLLKKNDASAITSLVMSQDEIEYILKYHDIDMNKPYITRTILDKYNLMDICIADESLEVAKFLFDDGDSLYETYTFDSLEKEARDNSYKKVVNLMSKMNR